MFVKNRETKKKSQVSKKIGQSKLAPRLGDDGTTRLLSAALPAANSLFTLSNLDIEKINHPSSLWLINKGRMLLRCYC